ncbi:MAG: ester cyclase [candidate division Zixibacteria bacterium]|nr:ester cyclase [candidate division Zixibacteria bacterium]
MSMRKQLEQVAIEWMRELWTAGNTSAVDRLHAADFVDHSAAGRDTSNNGFKEGIRKFFTAFPDFHPTDDHLVIDAEQSEVTIRWTAEGTHQGEFLGVAPTGKRITFRGIEILRIVDGIITERWGEWDGFDLLDQLHAPTSEDKQ